MIIYALSAFLGLLAPPLAVLRTRHRFTARDRIDGELLAGALVPAQRCSLTLAADGLIAEVVAGGCRLRRVEEAPRAV